MSEDLINAPSTRLGRSTWAGRFDSLGLELVVARDSDGNVAISVLDVSGEILLGSVILTPTPYAYAIQYDPAGR